MAMGMYPRFEFNLTIKKVVDKHQDEDFPGQMMRRHEYTPEEEVVEELSFKSLSAVEAIRKLIDYIISK